MITFHSVSKVVGRGSRRKVLLDGVDWTLPPRAHYVILGQKGSGKTTLLQILNGGQSPTRGWVEKRAIVSSPMSLLKFATPFSTPRRLIHRLAKVYEIDDWRLLRFVEEFSELEGRMDVPLRMLSREAAGRLSTGLFYGVPCDYYLFDGRFGPRRSSLKSKILDVRMQRRKQAGMVLATGSTAEAFAFGGIGGILFRGKLTFFASVKEAVAAFERLNIEYPVVNTEDPVEEMRREEEDDGDFFF